MHYIQDPAHGWFKVKISELHKLGIADKITHYSYKRGEWAYLEEDCDAETLFNAMRDAGKPMPKIVPMISRERPSKIRSYDRYI
jgi:hypothetical protein